MRRICYTSQATRMGDTALLSDIAGQARVLNERSGITGLLLFDGRRFLQALEGPADAVTSCYGRIARDPRHFDVRVIFDNPIDRREFGDWAMRQRLLEQANNDEFRTTVMRDVVLVANMNLRAFFVGFAALGEQ